MKKQKWIVLAVALMLIGIAASFLVRLQSRQKLGPPGLKLSPESLLSEEGKPVGSNSVYFPKHVLDYKSQAGVITTAELGWLPKDTTYGRREYVAVDGFQMTLSAVLMGTDRTSIHKPQICMAGQGWKIESTETVQIPIERPHRYSLAVKKMTNSKSNGTQKKKAIYVYWFVAQDRLTAEHWERMWWMAEHLIGTGELQRWAYVSCVGICDPGQETPTFNRMKELIAATVPDFQLTAGAPVVTTASTR